MFAEISNTFNSMHSHASSSDDEDLEEDGAEQTKKDKAPTGTGTFDVMLKIRHFVSLIFLALLTSTFAVWTLLCLVTPMILVPKPAESTETAEPKKKRKKKKKKAAKPEIDNFLEEAADIPPEELEMFDP